LIFLHDRTCNFSFLLLPSFGRESSSIQFSISWRVLFDPSSWRRIRITLMPAITSSVFKGARRATPGGEPLEKKKETGTVAFP
jgi:hypothetical protein